MDALTDLQNVKNPSRYDALPLIYHLDVAAMYPNIILTNRLQPVSIVSDMICSGCLFNDPVNDCKRPMEWEWKGELFPIRENEFLKIKDTMKSQN